MYPGKHKILFVKEFSGYQDSELGRPIIVKILYNINYPNFKLQWSSIFLIISDIVSEELLK